MKAKRIIILAVAIVLLIVVPFNIPVVKIQSTERWIVYRRWAVQDTVLWEWLHFLIPFADKVKVINIIPMSTDIAIPVSAQWAITKDNQTIWVDITAFYRYKNDELINIAKNYWFDILKEKLQKDIIEAFKQTIGTYTIFDVAVKQEEIRDIFILSVADKIWNYPIVVDDIKISNYDWSDSFDQQIALTMQIAQETKQSEQQLKKIEIEAQQQVKQAEANKQAEELNAQAMKIKWQGIKDYNEMITSNPRNMELEIKLKELEIEKIKAERRNWQYVSTNNYTPIPFANSSLLGQ